MNTIQITASNNNTILAIELGKYKCVACILDQNGGDFRFTTFDTSRAELQKLIAKQPPGVVIIEASVTRLQFLKNVYLYRKNREFRIRK